IIDVKVVNVNGRPWNVHSVGGSPAQAILLGILEIMPEKPDLVVSGANYGENLGTGITVSGTVGAALEAAANGIPA
ncbi:MAG: 5'/3'-nucleotidase SurE, partial [Phycisphaerae bacterium]|nr:5'/3'-nucleotidase SurE [Gammaproteobacteria bacterium]NIU58691.1 5'/3'-nucleotidase SurE [Phycisphaerae bacterium]NIW11018.1 5'/3'-nucleotidase SurE [Gammaproteobacteria bacterium]